MNLPEGEFGSVILRPELKGELARCVAPADAGSPMSILGISVSTSAFLPEGFMVLDGPRQMAVYNVLNGKGYVIDKDRMR